MTTLAAALVFLTGCGSPTDATAEDPVAGLPQESVSPSTRPTTPASRLRDARERWAQSDIDHYRWRYERLCFCPGVRMEIEVDNGQVVTAMSLARRSDHQTPGIATMEDLFDAVEQALAEAHKATVSYDSTTGAVTELSVDHIKNAIDDEYRYVVQPVTALQ